MTKYQASARKALEDVVRNGMTVAVGEAAGIWMRSPSYPGLFRKIKIY